MAQIAAAIWGTIGLFGLLVTIEPLKSGTADVSTMRPVAAIAAALAALLLFLPTRVFTARAFHGLLVAMTAAVTALAYAGGAGHGDVTLLYVFIVVFAAYFFSPRASAVHLALAVALLTSRLFFAEDGASEAETIRFTLLLPALVSVWALVSLLQKSLAEREERLQAQDVHDHATGLLSPNGLRQTLDAELARAVRHGRPLSLLFVGVSGPAVDGADPGERLVTAVSRAIIGRIRAEDKAARLGGLRFAVVAIETRGDGAAALAQSLAEQLRKRILGLGYESGSFQVAVGWADNLYEQLSREQMLAEAEHSLASTVPTSDGIALPPESKPPPPPVSRPDAAGVPASL